MHPPCQVCRLRSTRLPSQPCCRWTITFSTLLTVNDSAKPCFCPLTLPRGTCCKAGFWSWRLGSFRKLSRHLLITTLGHYLFGCGCRCSCRYRFCCEVFPDIYIHIISGCAAITGWRDSDGGSQAPWLVGSEAQARQAEQGTCSPCHARCADRRGAAACSGGLR